MLPVIPAPDGHTGTDVERDDVAGPAAAPPIVAPVAPAPTKIPVPLSAVAPAELVPIRFPTTVHDGASMSIP